MPKDSLKCRAWQDRKHKRPYTYVLVDVKECGHDGILDGSQIGLVPVDVEHPPDTVAACVIAGDVLQEEGLLTAVGRDRGAGIRKGTECKQFLLNCAD